MNKFVVSVVVALGLVGRSVAAGLGIGDAAPELELKEFVKGEPVKQFEKGKTYVIEFWATWCGPCRASVPHLTKLQKRHKDVVVIGVSIWEFDQSKVAPFVKEMGDKMDYRVALDDGADRDKGDEGKITKKGKMSESWMGAAKEISIPTAFIVNGEGKIAWIGHPVEMDKPLAQIAAGKWDLAEAAAEYEKVLVERKYFRAAYAEIEKFEKIAKGRDAQKTIETTSRLIEGSCKDTWHGLDHIALTLLKKKGEPDRDLMQVALKAAKRADELTEGRNAGVADTLARAYFKTDDVAKALETQERAVKLTVGTWLENHPEMKERLDQYREAAAKK